MIIKIEFFQLSIVIETFVRRAISFHKYMYVHSREKSTFM